MLLTCTLASSDDNDLKMTRILGFMQNLKMMWNFPFDGTVASGDDIHSQVQGNEQVSTLFDFCINPSHEGTLAESYTRGGFMQKQ